MSSDYPKTGVCGPIAEPAVWNLSLVKIDYKLPIPSNPGEMASMSFSSLRSAIIQAPTATSELDQTPRS